ncbi:unnamed protein product [Arabidopsis halleri]
MQVRPADVCSACTNVCWTVRRDVCSDRAGVCSDRADACALLRVCSRQRHASCLPASPEAAGCRHRKR